MNDILIYKHLQEGKEEKDQKGNEAEGEKKEWNCICCRFIASEDLRTACYRVKGTWGGSSVVLGVTDAGLEYAKLLWVSLLSVEPATNE